MEHSGGIQARLSGRYAAALFDLARESGRIDAVSAGVVTLRDALRGSDEFKRLIASPLVGRKDAGHAAEAIARTLELDDITSRFLAVLAANRRLATLPAVIRDYLTLAARDRGEVKAEVVTAHPLDDGQMAALKARLKSMTGTEVAVDAAVDPAILGGLVVRLGSRQIDGSIRTKLNALATAMKG